MYHVRFGRLILQPQETMAGRRFKRIRSMRPVRAAFMGGGIHFTAEIVHASESGMLVRTSQELELDTIGRLAIDMLPETFRTVVVVKRLVPGVGLALQFTQ